MSYRDWSKSMRMLLWIGMLFTMATAVSSAFVNVFLWKQTKSLISLAVYNGLQYTMMPIVFFLSSRITRIRRKSYLRIGIFLHVLFYGLVLWIGKGINPLWLGILQGTAAGLYWYGYHLLSLRFAESKLRSEFSSWAGMLGSISTMAAPLLSGFLITFVPTFGYPLVFSLSLGFFIWGLFISQRLESIRETELPMPIFQRRHPNWNRVLLGNFFQGIREGVFVFFAAIMVLITTGNEWGLGKYTAINAFLSSLIFFAVGKFLRLKWYNESMLIGSFLSTGAVGLFLFAQNFQTVMLYGIITAIFTPLFIVPFGARAFHVIDEAHERHEREYIVEREIVLNCGRVLSILSFIFTYRFLPEKWIPPYLLLVGSMQILAVLILRNVGFRLKKLWKDA